MGDSGEVENDDPAAPLACSEQGIGQLLVVQNFFAGGSTREQACYTKPIVTRLYWSFWTGSNPARNECSLLASIGYEARHQTPSKAGVEARIISTPSKFSIDMKSEDVDVGFTGNKIMVATPAVGGDDDTAPTPVFRPEAIHASLSDASTGSKHGLKEFFRKSGTLAV